LKRLGVEHIDLLQLHGQDYNTPVEETLATLDQMVREGKVRYIGCSNFSGWHLMKSLAVSDRYGYPRHVAHQAYYSLLNRDYEWELMPLGLDQGVGAVIWSPLGWGKLTGKIRRGQPARPGTRAHDIAGTGPHYDEERLFRIIDALDIVAAETGKTIPQVALNWLLQRPTVANIVIGARNEEQLVQNIGAVGWNLSGEQVAALDAASDVAPAYPVWHQRGFPQLHEPR
jgi:aryl-alcohol dehydrogenase-like predicted oxidoreductase